jgi:hypothetical protein
MLTFTHQKAFTSDCFKLISGALFVALSLIFTVEDSQFSSVIVSTSVPSSFNVSQDLTSLPLILKETLQF